MVSREKLVAMGKRGGKDANFVGGCFNSFPKLDVVMYRSP